MKTTTLLLSLLATVSAAPTEPIRRQGPEGLCGPSSFIGETGPGSADVRDCDRILYFLGQALSVQGAWDLDGQTRSLIEYQTCAFTARTTRGGRSAMGSQDAYDLLRDAVREKQRDGKIGASGLLNCRNGVEVEWRVQRAGQSIVLGPLP